MRWIRVFTNLEIPSGICTHFIAFILRIILVVRDFSRTCFRRGDNRPWSRLLGKFDSHGNPNHHHLTPLGTLL